MKWNEINKKFTEVVAEYIKDGYMVHLQSCGGSQGEIGKIDLYKGNDIIRVRIDSFCDFMKFSYEGVKITVSHTTTKNPEYDYVRDTIWDRELTVIEEFDFYKLDENWYIDDIEGYNAINDKKRDRILSRYENKTSVSRYDSTSVLEIASKFLKRAAGFKRVSYNDLYVEKVISENDPACYRVVYRGNKYPMA